MHEQKLYVDIAFPFKPPLSPNTKQNDIVPFHSL